MKKRAFWFHYNKPASQAAGCPILTVHFKGVCHLVKGITCLAHIETRIRKTQPRCVMAGVALTVNIDSNQYATIL